MTNLLVSVPLFRRLPSIADSERRAVFGRRLHPKISEHGRDAGVSGPMLEMFQRHAIFACVIDRRDPATMGGDADGFLGDAGFPGVFCDHISGQAVVRDRSSGVTLEIAAVWSKLAAG